MLIAFAMLQVVVFAAVVVRLLPGRRRAAAVRPLAGDVTRASGAAAGGAVTIVVPTLNEADRLGPCLEGLLAQGAPVTEILVVDSHSTDGTHALVADAARRDPRVRLVLDPPLPAGWIGKAWALEHGARVASNDWVLGMDADTRAEPGAVAAIAAAAERAGFDAVSFAPRFDGQSRLERWLQPALLVSLVLRTGAAGDPRRSPDRILANGQCFLLRRSVLFAHGGYAPVRRSFAEDVSLARHLARRGAHVGFLDGSALYRVESYRGAGEMWREWGRSIDLKDATTPVRQAADVALVLGAQGLWMPALAVLVATRTTHGPPVAWTLLAAATLGLLSIRVALLRALAANYARRGLWWWLSPFADPLAALRLLLSSLRRPTRWRSRAYAPVEPTPSSR